MAELTSNTIISLTNGKSCRVIEELGRGGQGIVYKVDYDGAFYALKWYISDCKPAFYANLENNVDSLKNVDQTEASIKLLLSVNQLNASYSVLQTAMSTSLLNYL